MRCNFGCCRGFFGIGIGRVPENLSCMMHNHNHNCCNCRRDRRDDCDDFGRSDCCECGNHNHSC